MYVYRIFHIGRIRMDDPAAGVTTETCTATHYLPYSGIAAFEVFTVLSAHVRGQPAEGPDGSGVCSVSSPSDGDSWFCGGW
jgi:hypothetical protein